MNPTPYINQGEPWGFRPIQAIRDLINGKTNNTGTITLTASSATTTITDPLIQPSSKIALYPTSATASAEATTTYVSAKAVGSATVTHANNALTTRTFDYVVTG